MDVINKFYSTVHTTVSQLSGVLPGNNVTREYEILEQVCTGGPALLWKVYNGYKKSTKQEVSVFVFEKKQLERWCKDDKEIILECLRRGVQQLTKIRHPHVLTVQHPLEESRDSLAFATEPVFASLANVVGDQVRPEKKLYDVEIRHGLLQLFDGLQFLHQDAKIVHRNICAETVMINKNRSWKLFGFDFCVQNAPTTDGKSYWPCKEYNTSVHMWAQPSLEYCAPEIPINNINTTDSDLFSLGVLIVTIYTGKPLKIFGNDFNAFQRYVTTELNQRKYPLMNAVPAEILDSVKALLHPSPHLRPKLHELKEVSYFHDVGVKTLNYLDSLYQWDNLQKSKFYKGLPQIIPTLPHRVNLHSILPYLIKEFINSPMIPFVLPNVLLIAEMSSQKEYTEHILNHLKPIFKLTEPIQILLIFMQKMDLLLKLTPAEEVKLHVLPLLYRSLECDMPQIQELCLNVLPTFSNLIDYNAMKNAVIPRIKKLCLTSQNVSVKVNCLISIGKLLEDLDKWLVLDDILPFLQQIQSREPAIIMAIIGIYKIALTNTKLGITKDVMAHKCIPFLMPLSVENGLTISQFNVIVSLIKEMVNRVEKEQREKLEQLAVIQRDNKPKEAAEILADELEKSNLNEMHIFSSFSTTSTTALTASAKNHPPVKEQLKTTHTINNTNNSNNSKNNNNQMNSLSDLMNSNLKCLANNSSNNTQQGINLMAIIKDTGNNNSNNDWWQQISNTNNSNGTMNNMINPLVMNQQLQVSTSTISTTSTISAGLAPSKTNHINNNNNNTNNNGNQLTSLDDLDPFGNTPGNFHKSKTSMSSGISGASGTSGAATTANTFTLQKPTVNYIYPPGYQTTFNNNSKVNSNNTSSMSPFNIAASNNVPLMPQQTHYQTNSNSNDATSTNSAINDQFNTLSQQDILNFLN